MSAYFQMSLNYGEMYFFRIASKVYTKEACIRLKSISPFVYFYIYRMYEEEAPALSLAEPVWRRIHCWEWWGNHSQLQSVITVIYYDNRNKKITKNG